MTDPHLPFLRAICARPEDDLPRLQYSDWLDETAGVLLCRVCEGHGYDRLVGKRECPDCHGTGEVNNGHAERSEFIRVQIELALWGNEQARPRAYGNWYVDCRSRSPVPANEERCMAPPDKNGSSECEYHALRRRERELILSRDETKWSGWARFAPELLRDIPGCSWKLRRGFAEELSLPWEQFRTHANAIRERTPLRRVRLTTEPVGVTVIAQENGTWNIASFPGLEFELPQRAWDIGPITWDESRLSEVMPQSSGPIP